MLERVAEDTQLGLELGALQVAMVQAIQEIDDPVAMSMAISRIANASAQERPGLARSSSCSSGGFTFWNILRRVRS